MNKENQIQFPFTPLKNRKITAVFDDPLVSSDGGLMLLREALIATGKGELSSETVGNTEKASTTGKNRLPRPEIRGWNGVYE